MSPSEERQLIEEASAQARSLDNTALFGVFRSVLHQCSFIAMVGGDIMEAGEEAAIEFTILRTELEDRGLIRFH